jgi:hypothetical protein
MNVEKTELRLKQIIATCDEGFNARISKISMYNLIRIKKTANFSLYTLRKWGTISQENKKYLKALCRQYNI